MNSSSFKSGEREPGLALSILVSVAFLLGLLISDGMQLITRAAKQDTALPAEIEVSLELGASPKAAAEATAEEPPAAPDAVPAAATALDAAVSPDNIAVDKEVVPTPAEEPGPEEPAVASANEQNQVTDLQTPVEPAPPPALPALSSFPGNEDLMPKPKPANRLNPALAGMPMPSRPRPVASPTEGEGSSREADAPESGAAAPELQVTALSGQSAASREKGGDIVVQALINHLGVVEAVEILEGSPDKIADVMAANALKQQRFRFNPPVPPGQKVLRTFTLHLSGAALP